MYNASTVRALLMKARGLDATAARKLYRRALNEALPLNKIDVDELSDLKSVSGGKTLSGVIDLMPAPAILGALYDLAKGTSTIMTNPEDLVVHRIRQAIVDPDEFAIPNPRSKSGYGYGHNVNFPMANAKHVIEFINKEAPLDINALTSLVLIVYDGPVAQTEGTFDQLIKRAVQAVSDELSLNVDEHAALLSASRLALDSGYRTADVDTARAQVTAANLNSAYHAITQTLANEGATPMPTTKPAEISVDPNFADAISSLLGKATNGAVTNVVKAIDELIALRTEKAELSDTIAQLNTKLASAPAAIAKTGSVHINADELTYEVVMRSAAELFPNPKTGKKLKQLDFEIPTLVWRDSDGTVVDHPDVEPLDNDYVFRASHVLKLAVSWLKRKYVWTHGHSGSGKTTLHGQFFARIGLPVYRLNLDSSLERSDLVGHKELRNDGGATVTTFVDGILPRVMVNPGVLILDEIDYGRADILATIQRALEGKGLLLTEDGGRLVQPHELFVFAATANSRGQGDEWGVYPGIRPMNAAFLDRFGAMVQVDYLTEEEEKLLLQRTHSTLDESFVTQLSTFAKMVREAFVNGEISTTLSPRGTLAICDFYGFFQGPMGSAEKAREMALEMVVIDKTTEDNKQRILELAARAFS